ncbi:MAG: hypothetical protein IKN55_02980 [Oscillospiraceae bacterium]|nr:hypothetical protein [Oscillospiraceae bacterium]
MDEQEMIRFLRSELYQAMERDPELRAALKHIDAGKGTFQDTAQYSERTSELLGQILSRHVDELPEGMREAVCKALLRERYEEVNGICAEVQEQLDAQNDIRLQPQRAPYPAERVQQVAHALEDPTVALSVIQRRARAPVANVSKSFHDDCMRENADVRSRLGFKCYLNRVAATGCCKWCTDIAGRYVYGDHPDEVFHRHDNCGCTVTFENGRERQDVWSKRTWQEDPAEVEANGFEPVINSQERAREIEENGLRGLTKPGQGDILRLEAESPFKNPKTPLKIDSRMQSKHIRGGKRYNDYMQSHDIEPSYLTISEDKAQELVEKFHGTGILKLNQAGNVLPNEIIIDNDEVVGVVVNNLTGASQETTAFKIQYGTDGTHIVPTYESQKRYYIERRSQNGHDWLLRQKM